MIGEHMLKNYLIVAYRNLLRFKSITIINILGLSIGLAASYIMILYVINELSVDVYNEKLRDIYLVSTERKDFGWTELNTPWQLAPTLKAEIPDVETVARVKGMSGVVKIKDKIFTEGSCKCVDPEIFDILALPLKYGQRETLFKERNSVVICESTAKIYYGDKSPLGETISFTSGSSSYDLIVTGIIKDLPTTSTFSANLILPLFIAEDNINTVWGKIKNKPLEDWSVTPITTYTLLSSKTQKEKLDSKLELITGKHLDPTVHQSFHFFPLKDVYFHSSQMMNSRFPNGNLTNVYIYSLAAFLLLLIATINFIVLSTSTASLRTKEIGVRKVLGAERQNIVKQILFESLAVSLLVIPFAVLLVEYFLPDVSTLLGTRLSSDYFHNWKYITLFLAIDVLVGIVSGSYLSLYLSRLNPSDILRNKFNIGKRRKYFRNSLLGIQMIIFIGMILASITIYKQLRFFYTKDFGFNKDDLLVFYSKDNSLRNNFEAFKSELKNNPNIISVSGANLIPGTDSRAVISVPRKDNPTKAIKIERAVVDRDFIETMQMKIIKGRDFYKSTSKGIQHEIILNETAVKELGIKDPIGETLVKTDSSEIVGIVKDFNFHSLYEPIGPMCMSARYHLFE